jgi:hypothetical protein
VGEVVVVLALGEEEAVVEDQKFFYSHFQPMVAVVAVVVIV